MKIIKIEGLITANFLARKLGKHYDTAKNILEDLYEKKILDRRIHKTSSNYEMRFYEMREDEHADTDAQRDGHPDPLLRHTEQEQ